MEVVVVEVVVVVVVVVVLLVVVVAPTLTGAVELKAALVLVVASDETMGDLIKNPNYKRQL